MLRDLDDMQQMVSSTLSFIREDSASEPTSKVDIGSLLERVCNDLEDAGHDVELSEVPRWTLVDCRSVALGRALSNLLAIGAMPIGPHHFQPVHTVSAD